MIGNTYLCMLGLCDNHYRLSTMQTVVKQFCMEPLVKVLTDQRCFMKIKCAAVRCEKIKVC